MSDVEDNDVRWLRQLQLDKAEALADVFSHYRPQLRRMVSLRLATSVRARVDASDLLQETYIEARRQLPGYLEDPAVPVYVWLRQLAADRLRKTHQQHIFAQKRSVAREIRLPQNSSLQLAAPYLAKINSPSREALRRELHDRVERSFRQLKIEDQEVILLRFFEGLSNTEAAAILGVTPQGATMRFGRAMARFDERLKTEFQEESQL